METSLFILFVLVISLFFIIKWGRDLSLIQKVTSIRRGTRSERHLILRLLKGGFSPDTLFHDLYVEKQDGSFSQIDIVTITRIGIFVFEVKDYSGWLFGKGYQKYWTQVLNYGREKHRFYNPIMQNRGHIRALREKLKTVADVPFYSVVVFYGNCEFRNVSEIPDDVIIIRPYEILPLINRMMANKPLANYTNEENLFKLLHESVANGSNPQIRHQHIEYIRQLPL